MPTLSIFEIFAGQRMLLESAGLPVKVKQIIPAEGWIVLTVDEVGNVQHRPLVAFGLIDSGLVGITAARNGRRFEIAEDAYDIVLGYARADDDEAIQALSRHAAPSFEKWHQQEPELLRHLGGTDKPLVDPRDLPVTPDEKAVQVQEQEEKDDTMSGTLYLVVIRPDGDDLPVQLFENRDAALAFAADFDPETWTRPVGLDLFGWGYSAVAIALVTYCRGKPVQSEVVRVFEDE